jgi:hypothetical protein
MKYVQKEGKKDIVHGMWWAYFHVMMGRRPYHLLCLTRRVINSSTVYSERRSQCIFSIFSYIRSEQKVWFF